MTSAKASDGKGGAPAAPIAEAIDKNKKVAKEVKDAADELAVVHAVLDQQLPDQVREDDVAQAVAHTNDLEKRLSESGKKLDEVNRTLERAVQPPRPPQSAT